jgi:SAM-dependent methyltransferase
MSLYQRLLGHPFVYDRIRPLVVGGIDWSPLYRNLDAGPDDVILDVGCGTGIAHQYLGGGFAAYHGFDTDPVAIDFARKRAPRHARIEYSAALVTPADVARLRPTRIILSGLLHHLSDADALALLRMCAAGPQVKRIATSDVVYLPREPVSNLLAALDRGKFVRKPDGYRGLIRDAGLAIVRDEIVRSHPTRGKALYFMTTLVPAAPSGATSGSAPSG